MSNINIRFGGFGGQGIILSSVILGRAAAIYEGKDVIQNESYGQQARGGECMSEIIISSERILYPVVDTADVLSIMSQPALKEYLNSLRQSGCLIIDSDIVKYDSTRNDIEVFNIPATRTGTALGGRIVANLVMLGALVEKTKVISEKSLEKAVKDLVPPSMADLNIKAAHEGRKLMLALLG